MLPDDGVKPSAAFPWSTEKIVEGALSQTWGFVPAYVRWAREQTDAPLAYHVGCALSLVASVFPPTITLPGLPGNAVPGNLFTILVGRQGIDRKTTALVLARKLLAHADPARIGTLDGSVEGLIDSLPEQPQQTVFVGDLGVFFEQTRARSGGNIYANVKMRLLDLFDSEPIFRRLSKNQGKEGSPTKRHTIRCENPRVSILGGINPVLVESAVERNDWDNGLMSRMVILWAQKERMSFRSTPVPGMYDAIDGFLRWVVAIPPTHFGPCEGFTPTAQGTWEGWTARIEAENPPGQNRRVVGPQARAPYLAARIAMLLEWSRFFAPPKRHPAWPDGATPGVPWKIEDDTLRCAIHIATISYQSALTLATASDATTAVRLRRVVMECIPPGAWTPFSTILRGSALLKKQAKEVLDTLVAERTLTTSIQSSVLGIEPAYMRSEGMEQQAMIFVPRAVPIPTDATPVFVPQPQPPFVKSERGWFVTSPGIDRGPLPEGAIPLPNLGPTIDEDEPPLMTGAESEEGKAIESAINAAHRGSAAKRRREAAEKAAADVLARAAENVVGD